MKMFDEPALQKRFKDMHSAGMTDKEIAADIPCGIGAIREYRIGLGLEPNGGSGRGGWKVNSTTRKG